MLQVYRENFDHYRRRQISQPYKLNVKYVIHWIVPSIDSVNMVDYMFDMLGYFEDLFVYRHNKQEVFEF